MAGPSPGLRISKYTLRTHNPAAHPSPLPLTSSSTRSALFEIAIRSLVDGAKMPETQPELSGSRRIATKGDFCTLVPNGERFPLIGDDFEEDESDNDSDGSSVESSEDANDPSRSSDNEINNDDGRLGMAVIPSLLWQNGQTIRIRFLLGGDPVTKDNVKEFAAEWEKYAHIKFKFVEQEPSDIRISFETGEGGGHWSRLGTDALDVPDNEATMNLELDETSSISEVRRVVLHEFGHALGCVHEHSSPTADIKWDKKKVYEYYRTDQGWSKETVDDNVFEKFTREQTQFSRFDPSSIMLYPIPAWMTKNGFSTQMNDALSDTDKAFIAQLYPKPGLEPCPSPNSAPRNSCGGSNGERASVRGPDSNLSDQPLDYPDALV